MPFSLRFGRCHFTIVLKEKFTIILECVLYINVYLYTIFVIEVFGGGGGGGAIYIMLSCRLLVICPHTQRIDDTHNVHPAVML